MPHPLVPRPLMPRPLVPHPLVPRPEILVVGTSLGGLAALKVLLRGLPPRFELPIAIVQHRDRKSGSALVEFLQQQSSLPVAEAVDKQEIVPGTVSVAPPDYHLLVERGHLALSTDPPVQHARPSIDVLFESAADVYGDGAAGLVLTGASRDGARGLARIKEVGGLALVQEPATAECAVMPAAAIAGGAVDRILPLDEIAPFLADLTHSRMEAST